MSQTPGADVTHSGRVVILMTPSASEDVDLIDDLLKRGIVVVLAPSYESATEWFGSLSSRDSPPANKRMIGPLEIDTRGRSVKGNRLPLSLTELEFRLLDVMTRDVGRALSFRELGDLVWGHQSELQPDVAMVRSLVQRLRAKLAVSGCGNVIESVRGYGFRFSALSSEAPHPRDEEQLTVLSSLADSAYRSESMTY
jgi:DNA-binding winged helix-turn-helix (wHTH) protein